MLASIIKRDGTEVAFDSVKILNAITKANKASGEDMSPTDLLFVTEKVCRKLEAQNLRHVEEIQDVVEETLIQYDYAKTAKAYILYRAEHTKRRNAESYLMEIYKTLTYAPAIEEDIKRENANIDGDTAMGTMLKYGSEGPSISPTTTSCPRTPRPRTSTVTSISMTRISTCSPRPVARST